MDADAIEGGRNEHATQFAHAPESASLRDRLVRAFSGARAPWLLGALALIMSLPAMRLGLQLDDHIFRAQFSRGTRFWEVFHFTLADVADMRSRGLFSWWSSPRLQVHFFRPLALLLHALEFRAFAQTPAVMLAISAMLYAGLVVVTAFAYRRINPVAGVSMLAALLYAIDEAHAMSVGWIAGRNTLLAAFFSVGAFLLFMKWRESRSPWLQLASVLSVALGLLSCEAGLWSLAYLAAYALVFEAGALAKRLLSIAPQLAVGSLWAVGYAFGHFGLPGANWYRDLTHPVHVLGQGLLDLPIWAFSLFGPSVVSAASILQPTTSRLIALPYAVLALALLLPITRRSREARFYALATLFCVIPLFPTVATDRMAFGASFGAFGWMACFIHDAQHATRAIVRWGRGMFLGIHVGLALLLFQFWLGGLHGVDKGVRELFGALTPVSQVVLLNAPVEFMNVYAMQIAELPENAAHKPDSLHTLYAGRSDLTVKRLDERSLELQVPRGWGRNPNERFFCTAEDMPGLGEVRPVRGMGIRVVELTSDGLPSRVQFHFDSPLESPDRQWLTWRNRRPIRWVPPAIGASEFIAGVMPLRSMPE